MTDNEISDPFNLDDFIDDEWQFLDLSDKYIDLFDIPDSDLIERDNQSFCDAPSSLNFSVTNSIDESLITHDSTATDVVPKKGAVLE